VFSERESVSENEREETKEEKKIFFFPSLQKPKKKTRKLKELITSAPLPYTHALNVFPPLLIKT
jgi:hypothetical protein